MKSYNRNRLNKKLQMLKKSKVQLLKNNQRLKIFKNNCLKNKKLNRNKTK